MERGSVVGTLATLLLIAITTSVIVARPITHPFGHLFPRYGFTRMSLMAETPESAPVAVAPAFVAEPDPTAVSSETTSFPFVIKTRWADLRPVPFRRLKLPARSADHSPTAH